MNRPHDLQDDPVLSTYADLDAPEPSDAVDRAILHYARRSARRPWHHAPQFIWPISAAAALLIAVGLISQIGPLLPAPGHPEIDMPRISAPQRDPLPPEPPVGQEDPRTGSAHQTGVLEYSSELESRRIQLDNLVGLSADEATADVDLLFAYFAFRRQWPDFELPQELDRTINAALARREFRAED